jgi:hypothetical protein
LLFGTELPDGMNINVSNQGDVTYFQLGWIFSYLRNYKEVKVSAVDHEKIQDQTSLLGYT